MANKRVKDRTLARATRVLAGTVQAGLLVTGLTLGTSLAHAQASDQSQNQSQGQNQAQAQAQPAAGANDAQVQTAVQSALTADGQLKGQKITASVSQGTVTLSGNVADDSQRIAAEQTTAQVTGVRSINDSIVVAGQNDASNQGAPANSTPDAGAQNGAPSMPPPPPVDSSQQQPTSQDPQQGQQYPQQGGQSPQPYPQQGQYGQQPPYYGQRGQYAPPPPPASYAPGVAPEKQNASGPVILPTGLQLSVRTTQPLSTKQLKDGDIVQFTAASDVYANGILAIPRGAVLNGQVVGSKNAGAFGGSPKLDIKLTTLQLGGQSYPLVADNWSSQGPNKAGYTATNTVGGAAFGAIIGGLAGGGLGAGIGAVAGGASGAAVSGATRGPQLYIPAEAMLQFRLAEPLTVQPVNYSEAQRLEASAPQVPVLRTRPAYAVAPYPYYPRPYYVYPAPYYARPY
jgi:hypothetical protein